MKAKIFKKCILIAPFLLLVGCLEKNNQNAGALELTNSISDISAKHQVDENKDENSDPEKPIQIKRPEKIIKEAFLELNVDDYKEAKKQVDSCVYRLSGYISKEDEIYSNHKVENTIMIRVLNNEFENLLEALNKISDNIDHKSVNSYDVTEEYIDIEARLNIKKEFEESYKELLYSATDIKDILEIKNELCKVREDIESTEGKLRYMNDQILYSTINLTIYQKLDYKYRPEDKLNFGTRLYEGLDRGWKGFLLFIIGLMHALPFLLAIGVVFFVINRISKQRKLKKMK